MASIMDYLFKTSKQREAERLEREEIERFKIENPGVPPPLTEAEKAQLQRDEENRRLNVWSDTFFIRAYSFILRFRTFFFKRCCYSSSSIYLPHGCTLAKR
jgi:hypothetical protein